MTDDANKSPDEKGDASSKKKKKAAAPARAPEPEPEAPAAPVPDGTITAYKRPVAKKKAPAEKKKKAPAEKKAAPAKAKAAPAKKPAKTKAKGKAKKPEPVVEEEEDISQGPSEGKGKSLVIVESPAKAKTINKFLGKAFLVKASYGHVRDLPEKSIAVDIENNFEPVYEPLAAKKKVISELRRAARDAEHVYLACDMDREGEAIAWHISEILKKPKDQYSRVTFNEITKSAIEKAFQSPRDLDMKKVNAQQARRILDRIVGYKLSPLLWKKVKRGLSAGRVQSVAVKLVAEREKEIRAFTPIEYWHLQATLAKLDAPPAPPAPPPPPPPKEGEEPAKIEAAPLGPGRFFAKLVQLGDEKLDPEKFRIKNEAEALALKKELETTPFSVASVKKAERKENPSPPFITSTLQQAASSKYGFATKRTMRIAQQLYEGVELGDEGSVGLITYMRTDSTNLAAEAVEEARGFIKSEFGDRYLPDEARVYKRDAKSGAQEAHEAIRPTSALRTPQALRKFLNDEQHKVYSLIWERFVACQMPAAVFLATTVDVKAGRAIFRATGRIVVFDGHQRVSGVPKKEGEALLPELSEEEKLNLDRLLDSQHFTQPPARYNEGSLVKEMEKLGIGRPSTYATIISTIQDRGYVRQEGRRLFATALGEIVTDKLSKHFHEVMDTAFTSEMENKLDRIEDENADWKKVLGDFYKPFEKDLEAASTQMIGLNENPEESNIPCKKCGRMMVKMWNKIDFNQFLGCPGYKTDECKETMPLDEKGAPQVPEETDEECPECGSSMVIRAGRRGRYLSCSAYPACKVTRELADEGQGQLMPELEAECELCGKKMLVRRGRFGTFLGCTGYPECKSTRPIVMDASGKAVAGDKKAAENLPKVDVKCEKCGSPMAIRRSGRGPFLGCTAYPKCRGTAQLTEEMKAALPAPPPPKEFGEDCEVCGKPLVIRTGRRGPFAACSGYPECKNTKQITAGT
jgi:DNA topoisomerase-1